MSEATTKIKRLQPWNPFDYGRLLWWLLVTPGRLKRYRELYGRRDEVQVGAWLISTLLFLPFFAPSLALGLERLPIATGRSPDFLWVSLFFFVLWLLGGWRTGLDGLFDFIILLTVLLGLFVGVFFVLLGLGGERYFLSVAVFIAPLLTSLLADALAWDERASESLVLPVYVIGFLTTAPVRGMGSRLRTGQPKTYPLVRRGVQTGRPDWVARGLLLLLIVVYGYIIWGCFWGGEATVINLPTRAGF